MIQFFTLAKEVREMINGVYARLCAFRNQRGASAAEYAVIAGSIAAVVVLTVTLVGLQVQSLFQQALNAFN